MPDPSNPDPSNVENSASRDNGKPTPPEASAPDPFDLARLRLSQDFGSSLGIRKAIFNIPVQKPTNNWHVRVHPDESYRIETAVIELKGDREIYLVDRSLWPELMSKEPTFGTRVIYTAINRQGGLFLWPIRLPGPDGKLDSWNASALEAAQLAMEHWLRVASKSELGAYEGLVAEAKLADPEWPKESFQELIRIAFKNRFVDSLDHPVLRRLRGEI